jgi:outer membrane receptor protein involved in Fe transport
MEASDINTPIQIKPYTLLDLTANWNRVMGSPIDVSFFIKNLTDKEYTTSAISQYGDPAGSRIGIGMQAENIGTPRTFGVEMKVHFGSGV